MHQAKNSRMATLVVGRDRAHVKILTKDFPESEVVSAANFFEKIRFTTFLQLPHLKRDDHAPLIFAQKILLESKHFGVAKAKKFVALYRACYHGTSSPEDIFKAINGDDYPFVKVFEILAKIDRAMKDAQLVDGVSALFRAWQIIKNDHILPVTLIFQPRIHLKNLVDLTLLEIEVIKDLSRLGLHFDISFPLDFNKRGLNAAVDFAARQFEKAPDLTHIELSFDQLAKEGPLKDLVDNIFSDALIKLPSSICSIKNPHTITKEASTIASAIAAIKNSSPSATIAVVVRTFDTRAKIFKRALKQHGINVQDRKGIPISETAPVQLLMTLLAARRLAMPKKIIMGLIGHPLLKFLIVNDQQRAKIVSLIEKLGIDDKILPVGTDRTSNNIKKFRSLKNISAKDQEDLDILAAWLQKINNLLEILPEKAQLYDYLSALIAIIDHGLDESSSKKIKEIIVSLKASTAFSLNDPCLNLLDLISLLESEFIEHTIPYADHSDPHAVAFLLLPELLSQNFDHVFIADISFGRMPYSLEQDPLIDDQARITLNRIFKKPLLRIFLDDPFEPFTVPPRQALEPFWFASAIAAASKSIHFSCANFNEDSLEQAVSEFFIWLRDHVEIIDATPAPSLNFAAKGWVRLLQGIHDRHRPLSYDYQDACAARNNVFLHGSTSDFAFKFSQQQISTAFLGRLDPVPKNALTPTMIEAFAECRLQGFCEQILDTKKNMTISDEIDRRALGQIAHRALEIFFKNFTNNILSRREQIDKAVIKASLNFRETNFIASDEIYSCYITELKETLFHLVSKPEIYDSYEHQDRAFELSFGLPNSPTPPLVLKTKNKTYLLGGRIDRIDRRDDQFHIIDYKLSSALQLKTEISPKNILSRHFQMPIYLRLVANHFANNDQSKVKFSFASIRDGELLPNINENHPSYSRIFDDESQDGFLKSIDQIFASVADGSIAITTGEHCQRCDFGFFCRKAVSES